MYMKRSAWLLSGCFLLGLSVSTAVSAENKVYMNEAGWEVYLDKPTSDPHDNVCMLTTMDVFKKVRLFYSVKVKFETDRLSQSSVLALSFNRVEGRVGQDLSEPSQNLSFSFRMGNADYTRTTAVAKVVKPESDPVAAVIYSVDDRFNSGTMVNMRFAGRGTAEAQILEMDNGNRFTASFDTGDSIYPANAMNKCVNELRQTISKKNGLPF